MRRTIVWFEEKLSFTYSQDNKVSKMAKTCLQVVKLWDDQPDDGREAVIVTHQVQVLGSLMFPDTRNNITYVTFLENLSSLKVKEKEVKIKNETLENQEQLSRSSKSPHKFEQQLITPFEWLFANSVRLQRRRSRVRFPTKTHRSRTLYIRWKSSLLKS